MTNENPRAQKDLPFWGRLLPQETGTLFGKWVRRYPPKFQSRLKIPPTCPNF